MSEDVTTRMPDEVRLRALMTAYQAGDLAAFEQLHAVLSLPLRRWLGFRVGEGAEADDLTQETFLQMHRARHTYDPSYPVAPWAYAIARHVWLMHRRTGSRRPRATENVENAFLSVRGEAEQYAVRAEVRDALRAIPAPRRQAVIWHHVFGLSFREIAARLGIRETAAKLRSSRGMADLRAQLEKKSRERNDE